MVQSWAPATAADRQLWSLGRRHYTFYLYKNFVAPFPRGRLLLAAPYLYCTASLIARLRRMQTDLWLLGWLACIVITLVPAWLIEFRYHLASPQQCWNQCWHATVRVISCLRLSYTAD